MGRAVAGPRGSAKKAALPLLLAAPSNSGSTSEEGNNSSPFLPPAAPRSLGGGSGSACRQLEEKRSDRLSKEKQKFFRLSAYYNSKRAAGGGEASAAHAASGAGAAGRGRQAGGRPPAGRPTGLRGRPASASSRSSSASSGSSHSSSRSSSDDETDSSSTSTAVVQHRLGAGASASTSALASGARAGARGGPAQPATSPAPAGPLTLGIGDSDPKAPWGFAAAAAAAAKLNFSGVASSFCDKFVNREAGGSVMAVGSEKGRGRPVGRGRKSVPVKGLKGFAAQTTTFHKRRFRTLAKAKESRERSSSSSSEESRWAPRTKDESVQTGVDDSEGGRSAHSLAILKGNAKDNSNGNNSSSGSYDRLVGFGQLRSLYDGLSHLFTTPAHSRRSATTNPPNYTTTRKNKKRAPGSVNPSTGRPRPGRPPSKHKSDALLKSALKKSKLAKQTRAKKLKSALVAGSDEKKPCYPTWRQITKNGGVLTPRWSSDKERERTIGRKRRKETKSAAEKGGEGGPVAGPVAGPGFRKVGRPRWDGRRVAGEPHTRSAWGHMSPSGLVKTAVNSKRHEQDRRRLGRDESAPAPAHEPGHKKKRLIAEATQTHHRYYPFLVPQPPTNTASACMGSTNQTGKNHTHLYPLGFSLQAYRH